MRAVEGIQTTLARLPLVSTIDPSSSSSRSTTTSTIPAQPPSASNQNSLLSAPSSRRRKGPAFLPSEHDDLPHSVAFMVRLYSPFHAHLNLN